MSKKKSATIHLKRRFYERYNLAISNEELKNMVSKIQNQKADFIERQSNRVTIWKVKFLDNDYVVAYDKVRKTIVTVFPETESEAYRNKV